MAREIPDEKRCTGLKADGSRCDSRRRNGETTCVWHNPGGLPDRLRCTGLISGGYDHQDRKGERCTRIRNKGLTVCRMHGASKKAAQPGLLRIAEEKLMASASRLVGAPVDNPLTELALLAGRARALMESLETRVEALLDADSEDGTGDPGGFSGGIRYKGGAGELLDRRGRAGVVSS